MPGFINTRLSADADSVCGAACGAPRCQADQPPHVVQLPDACVQLYGGCGYMNEYRAARAWRDARISKIWAGSNEIMNEPIGRDLGL